MLASCTYSNFVGFPAKTASLIVKNGEEEVIHEDKGKDKDDGDQIVETIKGIICFNFKFCLFPLYPFFISVGNFHQACSVDLTAQFLQVHLCG